MKFLNIKNSLFWFLLLWFIFVKEVLAVTISIIDSPTTISQDEFTVGVSITGANSGTNYLRVDLYKEGSTSYFGETFNGRSWYKGSEGKQYSPISIPVEGTASATIKGRLGTPSHSEYSSPGQYKLKVRRYTSSGNSASNDQQNPQGIQIIVSFASPTPTPQPASTLLPLVTATPVALSLTVPEATTKVGVMTSAKFISLPSSANSHVLGDTTKLVNPSVSDETKAIKNTSTDAPHLFLSFVFIGFGIILSGIAGYLVYRQIKVKN